MIDDEVRLAASMSRDAYQSLCFDRARNAPVVAWEDLHPGDRIFDDTYLGWRVLSVSKKHAKIVVQGMDKGAGADYGEPKKLPRERYNYFGNKVPATFRRITPEMERMSKPYDQLVADAVQAGLAVNQAIIDEVIEHTERELNDAERALAWMEPRSRDEDQYALEMREHDVPRHKRQRDQAQAILDALHVTV